jgi:hypothetical protein
MFKSTLALFLAVGLPFGSTIDPAAFVTFCEYGDCSDFDTGIVLSLPDGTCFDVGAGGLFISEFLGDCSFCKFDYTNYLRKL